MPENDTQSLLKLNPVQPNSPSTQRQPNFISSQLIGGQTQIGQPSQQVGPDGDAAMYGALSEIAGGVQKAVGNFIDIASGMEKDKIKRAETFFEELNTKENLTPDEKQSQYDAYMAETWTPVLGNNWKSQMSVAMNKTWTSSEARDKYEASRYERDYTAWKDQKENKGRPETNEVIQEFNGLYADMYPSAKENTWYRQLSTKVNTAIDIANAEQAVIDFRNSLDISFPIPTPIELESYTKSANMELNTKFEQEYKIFFEIKKKIDSTKDYGEINSFVYKYIVDTVLEPQKKTLEPYAFKLINQEVDQLALDRTKKLVAMIRSENVTLLKQSSIANIASLEQAFHSSKNVNPFLTGWTRDAGNLELGVRMDQTNNLFATMWNALADSNNRFTGLHTDEQTKTIEESFKSWLNAITPEEKASFGRVTGLDTPQKIDEFINRSKFYLLSNEKMAGGAATRALNTSIVEARGMRSIFLLQDDGSINQSMNHFKDTTAKTLGIEVSSLEALAFSRDQNGKSIIETVRPIGDWFEADLTDAEKKNLNDRGFTANNFERLEKFRLEYIDLEADAIKNSNKGSGLSSGSGSSSSSNISFMDKSDSEITTGIMMDPKTAAAVHTARNILQEKSPEERDEISSKDRLPMERAAILINLTDQKFRLYAGEILGKTNLPKGLLMDKDGTFIPEAISPANSQKRLKVDVTNSLTEEGRLEYVRLQYVASELARLTPNNSDRVKFQTELKTLLTELAAPGKMAAAIERDPAKVYALAATLAGLSEGDPSGLNTDIFAGTDQNITKAMAALLKNASSYAGGILDISAGDELTYKQEYLKREPQEEQDKAMLENSARNSRIEQGIGTPEDLKDSEEVKRIQKHHVRKTFNQFNSFVSGVIRTLGPDGEGQMLPLIPSQDPSKNTLISINSVVANLMAAFTRSGSSAYRNPVAQTEFVKRMNFSGMGKVTSDGQLVGAFGNALWNITGRSLPDLSDDKSTIRVKVATDTGFEYKPWNSLAQHEKIGTYLALWSESDPVMVETILSGWLRQADDVNSKGIRTMDFFQESVGYLQHDILRPYMNPTTGNPPPLLYHNRYFDSVRPRSGMLPGSWFETPGGSNLTIELVRDGKDVQRGKLLSEAKMLSFDTYRVGQENVKNNWVSIGTPTDIIVDGKSHKVLLGEVTSEDQFVVTSYLSQAMSPDDYNIYEWWAKTLNQKPKTIEEYKTAVRNFAYASRSREFMGGKVQMPKTVRYFDPPVFTIMNALHNIDLTSPDVAIDVDISGNMSFEIGDRKYGISEEPPHKSTMNYPTEETIKRDREVYLNNKNLLEVERAKKRVQKDLGNTGGGSPYVAPSIFLIRLQEDPNYYIKLANSPEMRKFVEEKRKEEQDRLSGGGQQ